MSSTTSLSMPDKLGFLDQTLARTRYLPNLELARAEGRKARKTHGLHSAAKDVRAGKSRLAIIIDAETDFADDGRLPVTGAYDDVWRICQRLYQGTLECQYTDLILTIDMHPPITVHSEAWWEDEDGNPPDVNLPVQMELVDPKSRFPFMGNFFDRPSRPFRARVQSDFTTNQYAPHLVATEQGPIWVFKSHCHIGTDGIQLLPPLVELVQFMATARDIQPTFMFKGHVAEVDWFGPFRPCMDLPNHPQGGLQTAYLDRIRAAQRTEVFGEAEDFCVKNGMRQVLEYFGSPADRAVLESVAFVGDCTSPIIPDDPGSGNTANADFRRLMEQQGIRIIKHDLPFDQF